MERGNAGARSKASIQGMLRESLGRLLQDHQSTLLDNVFSAIFVKDLHNRILFWNRTAEEMYGWTKAEVVGKSTQDVLETQFPESPSSIDGVLFHEGRWEGELVQTRRDGKRMIVASRWTLLRNEGGTPEAILETNLDITEWKLAEGELRRLASEATSASRAKSHYLASMSHEIRTPLNGILGMADLLLATNLTSTQGRYLRMLKSSADWLLSIINDILDFAKIEAGKLELDLVPFSLQETVGDTVKVLAIGAHEKGLELNLRLAPDLPETVLGDSGRFLQVVINLVGNAIKFTDRGEVNVTLRAHERQDGQVLVHVSVADTGPGIDPGRWHVLFRSFSQGDVSPARRFGGTGLGLSISRHLVQAMGGRLWLENPAGGGSIFHATARFGLIAAKEPPFAWPEAIRNLPVLIVDDNATHRTILEELLTNWKMRPVGRGDGIEALREIRAAASRGEPYAVALLDAEMPGMDGFAVARQVRSDPDLTTSTLLMLNATHTQADVERCWEASVNTYLVKPIKPSELLNAILSLVSGLMASGNGTTGQASISPGVHLRLLLAEDNLVNQAVATGLLESRGDEVTVVSNGAQAVQSYSELEAFDVVLMDVQMPVMDGFEATAEIRRIERAEGRPRVAIIALTAHALKGDRERCLAAGMDEYIAKPMQSEDLAAVISRALARTREQPPAPNVPSTSGQAPVGGPVGPAVERILDPEATLARFEGNSKLLHQVIGIFNRDADELLPKIARAVEAQEGTELRKAAHRLRGSISVFGAQDVSDAALKLEQMGRNGQFAGGREACQDLEERVKALASELARL